MNEKSNFPNYVFDKTTGWRIQSYSFVKLELAELLSLTLENLIQNQDSSI